MAGTSPAMTDMEHLFCVASLLNKGRVARRFPSQPLPLESYFPLVDLAPQTKRTRAEIDDFMTVPRSRPG